MFPRRLTVAAFGAAILAVVTGTTTHAWVSPNRITYITFNRAVALPGVELSAGTYIFELATPEQHMNLVRVLSHDRRKIYTTQFAYVIQRPAAMNEKGQVTLREAPRGQAPTIAAWFPANEPTGRQFIYR
jgi:hypothetical protein